MAGSIPDRLKSIVPVVLADSFDEISIECYDFSPELIADSLIKVVEYNRYKSLLRIANCRIRELERELSTKFISLHNTPIKRQLNDVIAFTRSTVCRSSDMSYNGYSAVGCTVYTSLLRIANLRIKELETALYKRNESFASQSTPLPICDALREMFDIDDKVPAVYETP